MTKAIIAKKDDGEIQITFTVPFAEIKRAEEETLNELAKEVEVPGFRKGKAPIEKAKEKIPQPTLVEHSLGHILPKLLSETIKENNLTLVMYPKFELTKAEKGKDWEIVGKSCELPVFEAGNYKKFIPGEIRAASLKKELTREEKEQIALKALVDNVKIQIPEILLAEEVNSRLSSLLSRIEKLALTLEGYLSSIGKTPESLREEYRAQARESISLDLILSRIADNEKIVVTDKEIDEAIKASQVNPENRRIIEAILRKRKALEFLIALS